MKIIDDKLADRMYKSGKSICQIAERFDVSRQAVSHALKRMGTKMRPRGCKTGRDHHAYVHIPREWLSRALGRGVSMKEIARELGISVSTVKARAIEYGIDHKVNRRLMLQRKIHMGQPGSHKLTPGAVRRIRKYIDKGLTYSEIARKYDVSHQAIAAIANGRCWSWVE